MLGDIGSLFLFKPQLPGRNYQGRFEPFELNVPTAPADVGCFGFTLLASLLPGAIAPEVQALNAIKDQLLGAVLKSAKCDLSEYNSDGGSNDNSKGAGGTSNKTSSALYQLPPQSGDAGSGSGVTKLGQYYSKSIKPTGKSAGQAFSRRMFGPSRL